MKNVSIINFKNNCNRVNARKQIFKQIKLMCYAVIAMPFFSCFKVAIKAFHLSSIHYSSKSVELLCKSFEVSTMTCELVCACVAMYLLLKVYELEGK